MATQQGLFELLKRERVNREYNPAVLLSDIIPPTDALDPSTQLVESIQDEDMLEPLLLNEINGRFQIISGRRRYRVAEETMLETVPAMITRVSALKAAVLTIKLNRLRRANLIADLDAIEVLASDGFNAKQIDDLTSLLPQERKRIMRLKFADKRLIPMVRAQRVCMTLAEKIAKLPPKQQAQLLDKLDGGARLRVSDVHKVKEARTRAAVNALPQNLFTRRSELRTNVTGQAHSRAEQNQPQTEADRLLAVLRALQTSGALDFRNNRLSRQAVADAKEILSRVARRSASDEPEHFEPAHREEEQKYKTQSARAVPRQVADSHPPMKRKAER
jgi:ParB-like chromosome segregation protein Spo0J